MNLKYYIPLLEMGELDPHGQEDLARLLNKLFSLLEEKAICERMIKDIQESQIPYLLSVDRPRGM